MNKKRKKVKKKVIFEYSLIYLITMVLLLSILASTTRAQIVCSAPEHCGLLSDGNLCRTNDNPPILPASTFDNDIFFNACQNAEYVSDGNNWISCLSGQYILENIGAHDYFCNGTEQRVEEEINEVVNITKGNGQRSIIECCGSGLCNSNNAGVRLSTGQSITVDRDIPTITQVCPDNQHLIGLDNQGNIICEESIPPFKSCGDVPHGQVISTRQVSVGRSSNENCQFYKEFEQTVTEICQDGEVVTEKGPLSLIGCRFNGPALDGFNCGGADLKPGETRTFNMCASCGYGQQTRSCPSS